MDDKSILPAHLNGVVFVTGLRGIGKSLFGAQSDLPPRVYFQDWESKSQSYDEQLKEDWGGFGLYTDVPTEVARVTKGAPKGRDAWKFVNDQVDKIEPGQFTAAVIDTVGDLEEALADEINFQPRLYGVKETQSGGGWGGIYTAMSRQVGNFLTKLDAKGIRVVVAVAHVKPQWVKTGPVPNKYRSHGVNEWHDRSVLELVLVPGDGIVPAGLVQKETLAGIKFDKETGAFSGFRRLPRRIPKCTWESIRYYLEHPADLDNPAEGEVPTEEERSPYSEYFSREQLQWLVAAAQVKDLEVTE